MKRFRFSRYRPAQNRAYRWLREIHDERHEWGLTRRQWTEKLICPWCGDLRSAHPPDCEETQMAIVRDWLATMGE